MADSPRVSTPATGFHHEAILLHGLSLAACRDSVAKANILEVDTELKARLLQTGQLFDPHYDREDLMRRVQTLDSSSTTNATRRRTALESFSMRLFFNDPATAPACKSYLAMSYRCRDPPQYGPPAGHLHVPASPEIFSAVCSLLGPSEGLWFDIGCIDQADETDRETAISVMDILYKRAQRVIIVLWDIALSDSEADLLRVVQEPFRRACEQKIEPVMQGHGFPPYLDGIRLSELTGHPAFVEFACKIFYSKYFKRAFCGQEFRVARQCSFLLPCERTGHSATFKFCILDASFISLVVMVWISSFEYSKPQTEDFTQKYGGPKRIAAPLLRLQGILVRKAYRNLAESQADQEVDHERRTQSLCQLFDDIFGMEAGGDPRISDPSERALDANKDRLMLVLNSAEHPLSVVPPGNRQETPLTKDRCQSLIIAVALASDDALALCGRGSKLDLGPGCSTWVQRLKRHYTDTLSGPGNRLDRSMPLRLGTEDGNDYIDIGLRLLPAAPISETALSNARTFLRGCQTANMPCTLTREQNLNRNTDTTQYLTDMDEIKVGTIATLFQSKNAAELSSILSTQTYSPGSRLSHEQLEAVFDWSFALKTTVLNEPSLLRPVAEAFMTFVELLIGMLQHDMNTISSENYSWRPRAAMLDGHMCLLMALPETEFAVPDPIKWRECQNLSRCWLMARRPDSSDGHWTLLSATHLYAGEDFLECLEGQPRQAELSRVFGL